MTHRIVFSRAAEQDLLDLLTYLVPQAGDGLREPMSIASSITVPTLARFPSAGRVMMM